MKMTLDQMLFTMVGKLAVIKSKQAAHMIVETRQSSQIDDKEEKRNVSNDSMIKVINVLPNQHNHTSFSTRTKKRSNLNSSGYSSG